MKIRKSAVLFAVILSLMFPAGCGSAPERTERETQEESVTNPGSEGQTDEPSSKDDEDPETVNRFLGILEERAVRIGDVLYYSAVGDENIPLIMAADLNSMYSFPLCGKPECEHNDKNCNAYAGQGGPVQLSAYRGQLYYLDIRFNPITSVLWRIEPDGSARKEITQLNPALENTAESKSCSWFGIYSEKIYRCFCGDFVKDGELKNTAVLYSQPLSAGSEDKAQEILRVEGASGITACMEGHILYCAVGSRQGEESLFTIYAYNMDTGEPETLYSEQRECCPASVACTGNDLIFGYTAPAFRFSLTDRSLTELPIDSQKDDVMLIGESGVFIPASPTECRFADYNGKLLYSGFFLPPELRDEENLISPAGCSGGIFYFFIEYYGEENSVTYAFTAFDTADYSAKVLYSISIGQEMF